MYPPEERNMGLGDRLQKAQTLAITIQGYKTLEGVIIEDVGTYAFQRVSESGAILNAVVFIYIKGNVKFLSVESNTVVMNATKFDISVTSGTMEPIRLEKNTSKTLPIQYVSNSKEPL